MHSLIRLSIVKKAGLATFSLLLLLSGLTFFSLNPVPDTLDVAGKGVKKLQVLDRDRLPLTITYQNRWNVHDTVALHQIPEFLQQAFIVSEDKRFYTHHGADWQARFHALWQNIKAFRPVRGASTISEQAVRLIHPRPRTLWSRWLEGFEAAALEKQCSKADILEFYLNQVPYAAQRHGVVQAARYYFDRDLETLSRKEMLALAVLVRAPGRLDLHRDPNTIAAGVTRLSKRLQEEKLLSAAEFRALKDERFQLAQGGLPVRAGHFVAFVSALDADKSMASGQSRLHTTLDSSLQQKLQRILDQRIRDLSTRNVRNGAALVVDHQSNEILAWVVGNSQSQDAMGSQINSVLTPRQPGSTLKPFLYGLALEDGWTAATLIDDSPLTEKVATGLHTYHNYSRSHYGMITLRQALGNSLNIPAVKTVQFVGVQRFLERLRLLGIESLTEHPGYYGDGLALGNGEMSLFELVQAYSVLARQGIFRPLTGLLEKSPRLPQRRVFPADVCSLIGNILSDPEARRLEFGNASLLRFPVQTAIKTGTSSDYRDAWAIGYNYRYTFGIWLGNLDNTAMDGVTGSTGPALVLRAIAAELTRHQETRPLFLSPNLTRRTLYEKETDTKTGPGIMKTEWFIPGTEPVSQAARLKQEPLRIRKPASGLQLAMDPRIPDDREAFEFLVTGGAQYEKIDWYVDSQLAAQTTCPAYLWPLRRGGHTVKAHIWLSGNMTPVTTQQVYFMVH